MLSLQLRLVLVCLSVCESGLPTLQGPNVPTMRVKPEFTYSTLLGADNGSLEEIRGFLDQTF